MQCMGTQGWVKVVRCSLQVTSVQAGDWVVPLTSALGTWRDTGVWQAADWHKLPTGLPLSAAATLAINPPTALLMLEDVVPLQPGDVVVQNGATSGVGQVRVCWLFPCCNACRTNAAAAACARHACLGSSSQMWCHNARLFAPWAPPRVSLSLVLFAALLCWCGGLCSMSFSSQSTKASRRSM
jgi:hypothetical protein